METDELKWKTNQKLADLLKTNIEAMKIGFGNLDYSDEEKDPAYRVIVLLEEIYKRLLIKPRTIFNDEQFNM